MIEKVKRSYAHTPHDTNPITNGACDYVLVGVAGDIAVIYKDPVSGSDITDTFYVVAGMWHPINAKIIKSTGTTATGIHVGYSH